jgi:hypothetical protein
MAAPTFGYTMAPEDDDTQIPQVPLSEYNEYEFPYEYESSNGMNGPYEYESPNGINGPVVSDKKKFTAFTGTVFGEKENFTESTGMHLLFFLLYLSKCSNKPLIQESLTSGVSSEE